MPELPEIEILRRDLEREVVGRRIKEAEVRPGSNAMKIIKRHGRRREFTDLLEGARVDGVTRFGRRIALKLDTGRALVVDLGRSGRLVKTSSSEGLAAHTHVVLSFTIGGQLRIIDPKLTGEVFVSQLDAREISGAEGAAIDPLETPVAWQQFSSLLVRRAEVLKELLMDEGFMVGLGDIYSDEVLFVAGIRYDRPSNKLSSQDVRRLYRGLMETLQEAVKARGTSWGEPEFRDLHGNPGHFQLELKVYEREGEPCPRCRHEIEREVWNGAATYFCPQCQT